MQRIQRVGVLGHPLRPNTTPLAESIADSLRENGVDAWLRTGPEVDQIKTFEPETDMVIAIGGDGAMLRAGRMSAPHGVPVLGINVGRLGFLTEVRGPKRWPQALAKLLSGDYWIEERMMLGYAAWRGDAQLSQGHALNDVVVGHGIAASTVWLETYIDRGWTTTYNTDALIISTATGSTAYALAVGGPILPPELRNILVIPVAPHLSMERPIVVSEGAVIDVIIASETRSGVALAADGITVTTLRIGDRVRIHAGQHISRFVRLRERTYFYRSLLDRLEPRHPARSRPNNLPPVEGE